MKKGERGRESIKSGGFARPIKRTKGTTDGRSRGAIISLKAERERERFGGWKQFAVAVGLSVTVSLLGRY